MSAPTQRWRPITAAEMRLWLAGANFGAVAAGFLLRTDGVVPDADPTALYLRATD